MGRAFEGTTGDLAATTPGRELDVRRPRSAPHRVATLAGRAVDGFVFKALRRLFVKRGIPYMSPQELERSLAMLRCYTDPAILADPDQLLAPPSSVPNVRTRWQRRIRGGSHTHWVFDTPYRPVHDIYRAEFRRYDNLDTVHLFGWQHARPAPAQILITHGWGVGSKRIHEYEFGIDMLFRRLGLDVYYYVMPFHWLRKPSRARFSGELHPSPNLMRTNEAFIQTVMEIRTAIGVIKKHNAAPLGMMGSSLGGYTTALVSSLDDRLDYAIPVMPPASLADLFWDQGEGDPARAAAEAMGMTRARFNAAWALHSPLSYAPKVPWSGRMLVSATGDGLVTPQQVDTLWNHWERPRHHRFAGGHILQVYAAEYHRRVARFLDELGYLPEGQLHRSGVGQRRVPRSRRRRGP
jgi:hypothetical protein